MGIVVFLFFAVCVIIGVILIIIGLSNPGDNVLINIVCRIHKKYFPNLVLVIALILSFTAAAWAGEEKSRVGFYWRVVSISNIESPEGCLVGRKLRIRRNFNPNDDMVIQSSLFDPEWDIIKKVKLHDWIWAGLTNDGKTEVVFDREPSASDELKRNLLERQGVGE